MIFSDFVLKKNSIVLMLEISVTYDILKLVIPDTYVFVRILWLLDALDFLVLDVCIEPLSNKQNSVQ